MHRKSDWRYSHADVLFIVLNSAVLSMLTASLCDWRYSDADLLIIEVLFDLKQMHCTIAQSRMQC